MNKCNIFEMGENNSDYLESQYDLLKQNYKGSLEKLEAFVELIEREWNVSVNMRPERIFRFLTLGYCDSIHGYMDSLEKTIRETSDIRVDREVFYRNLLKKSKDKRIAFEQQFDGGDKFKYGALNIGGIGVEKYGCFCVILDRLKVRNTYP